MEFVPYDQFKDIKFIAEGGFSKIYKATWIDGPIRGWNKSYGKPLCINYVNKYYGITQDPTTQEILIIMPYYNSGDLINYMTTDDFYSISWKTKLHYLRNIITGLENIHKVNIIHRDFHSGNIFFDKKAKYTDTVIGDLGISKSATETTDDNENYGIIPYMAPEIFKGQKYTKASDIYSFGMIMWE
ncbi:kinase-like domain-containing protein, partial [Glomus cerebriforme]